MNKGECGELLALALACCDFSIRHAEGAVELSLKAVGKGLEKGKKVRLLVRDDKSGDVYANEYPRRVDEKRRVVLPVPRITRSSLKVAMPPSAEFRRTVERAVKAVATKGSFQSDKDVKAVLDQLSAWGFPLNAANASSKEDIYFGSYRTKPVRGVSVKTHGLAGDSALLNASALTRCLWRVEVSRDLSNFPFPCIRGPDGKALMRGSEAKGFRFKTERNWLRKSMGRLKSNGSFKLILPTDKAAVTALPMSLRVNKAGTSFIETLGSEQSRLLAACSLYRYTDPPKKRGPNVEEIAEAIYDNIPDAEFLAAVGMNKPSSLDAMMSHLKKALMAFARGLTPTTALKKWSPESAVGGIAFLSFDKRDGKVYFRYFDPAQDEKQVVDFSVDYASPDTASTQRHEFGFVLDRLGRRADQDIAEEVNKFYENDTLPAGSYYTHTIMAYRHRPDAIIFEKDYLDKWRDMAKNSKKRAGIKLAHRRSASSGA